MRNSLRAHITTSHQSEKTRQNSEKTRRCLHATIAVSRATSKATWKEQSTAKLFEEKHAKALNAPEEPSLPWELLENNVKKGKTVDFCYFSS